LPLLSTSSLYPLYIAWVLPTHLPYSAIFSFLALPLFTHLIASFAFFIPWRATHGLPARSPVAHLFSHHLYTWFVSRFTDTRPARTFAPGRFTGIYVPHHGSFSRLDELTFTTYTPLVALLHFTLRTYTVVVHSCTYGFSLRPGSLSPHAAHLAVHFARTLSFSHLRTGSFTPPAHRTTASFVCLWLDIYSPLCASRLLHTAHHHTTTTCHGLRFATLRSFTTPFTTFTFTGSARGRAPFRFLDIFVWFSVSFYRSGFLHHLTVGFAVYASLHAHAARLLAGLFALPLRACGSPPRCLSLRFAWTHTHLQFCGFARSLPGSVLTFHFAHRVHGSFTTCLPGFIPGSRSWTTRMHNTTFHDSGYVALLFYAHAPPRASSFSHATHGCLFFFGSRFAVLPASYALPHYPFAYFLSCTHLPSHTYGLPHFAVLAASSHVHVRTYAAPTPGLPHGRRAAWNAPPYVVTWLPHATSIFLTHCTFSHTVYATVCLRLDGFAVFTLPRRTLHHTPHHFSLHLHTRVYGLILPIPYFFTFIRTRTHATMDTTPTFTFAAVLSFRLP